MPYGDDFVLTLFTNDPGLARRADAAGIDRVGPDLEKLGKTGRQDPRSAWISDHVVHELPGVGKALRNAKLFARTNPLNPDSRREIEELLDLGVRVLMLPMFRSVREVEQYVGLVDGRAEVSLLVETAGAVHNIREIVKVPGIGEIHVGLNDLHLDLGMRSHFEVLVSPLMSEVAECVRDAGLPFGFGGVGRVDDASLRVRSELVYPQYPFLGATRALVSRVFLGPDPRSVDLTAAVSAFRRAMSYWAGQSREQLRQAHQALARRVAELVRVAPGTP
jgi:hypothetical protein